MNFPSYLSEQAVSQFIDAALAEDIGEGDHSTLAAVPESLWTKARLLVKDNGVFAGAEFTRMLYKKFDSRLSVSFFNNDGDEIKKGDIAFIVEGPARSILTSERVVLNCLQRMSGIATYAHHLTGLIAGTGAQLLDTRKTTPNFRILEKWAVAIGGATNHRYALYDMIMLKDNHIDMAGGITKAMIATHAYVAKLGKPLRIEVETRTLTEVEEIIAAGGADVIMLDNMSIETMREAVKIVAGRYKTEASGGITEQTLRKVAECGVDFISVGALTHSAKSLDLSLKVITG